MLTIFLRTNMSNFSAQNFTVILDEKEQNWFWAPKYFPTEHHASLEHWVDFQVKKLSKIKFSTPGQKKQTANYLTQHVQQNYGMSSDWTLFHAASLKHIPKTVTLKLVDKRKSPYDDLKTSVTGFPDENTFEPTVDSINTSHLGQGFKAIRQMSNIHEEYNKLVYGWESETHYFFIEYVEPNGEEFYKMIPQIDSMVYGLKTSTV